MRTTLAAAGQVGKAGVLSQCADLPSDFSRDRMYWLDLAAKHDGVNAMLQFGLSAALELDPNNTLNVADPTRAAMLRQRAIDYLQQAAQAGVAEAYPALIRYFGTGSVADKDTALAYAYALAYSRLGGQDSVRIESYYATRVNTAERIQGTARAIELVNACCKAG